MFKRLFFLGLASGLLATIVCYAYSSIYTGMIADFSEATGITHLLAFSFMITMAACFVQAGIGMVIKNEKIATTIFNLLLSGFTVMMVFLVLKREDPEFKNEDAAIMVDYFKGYLMPFVFIPTLSWFTLRPIFTK